ncbi:hypothetical protein AA106555_0414 [Neokomagataea thailandica NBRC 106555]|uniref:Uncharacterized protein n=1 Tax=Neokomagataea thailandica NBRC 106555 TaxID=1223520 RepID=A0ABQ0QN28_9PROT|nr:hypothetical protein AA106555_0414 [Neokomagataea thailandica NBRC 106555]
MPTDEHFNDFILRITKEFLSEVPEEVLIDDINKDFIKNIYVYKYKSFTYFFANDLNTCSYNNV